MDLSLSYSKYNMINTCILKYIHTYVFKTQVTKEELTYPLALGTLTHLFIDLYHEKKWDVNEIVDIENDLDKLYNLIDMKYLAKDFKTGQYAVKFINVTENTTELIEFIKKTNVVFHHAFKLFKNYLLNIYDKIESNNILTEFTFNSIVPISNEDTLCLYGSIDLLFWKEVADVVSYLYIADFKTGKNIDNDAINQLYFYYYNLLNYNFEQFIVDNIDNINLIKYFNQLFTGNLKNVFGIIFKIASKPFDNDQIKVVLNANDKAYQDFVKKMFDTINTIILPLHKKNKNYVKLEDYYLQFNDIFKYIEKENCKEESKICAYCKFKNLCDYRMGVL